MRKLLFVCVLLAACGGGDNKTAEAPAPPPPPPPPMETMDPAVAQAVDLNDSIRANPAGAAEVLTAKGMTQAQLDELMFKIASDPKLSEQFEKHAKR